MTVVELLIVALATYRSASIIAQETISASLRAWLAQGATAELGWRAVPQPRRFVGQLLSCVFCVSVWAGWVLLAAWLYGGPVGRLFVGGLAASGGAITLGTWLAHSAKNGGQPG